MGFSGGCSNSRHTSKCEPFLEGCRHHPSRNAVRQLFINKSLICWVDSGSLTSVPFLSKPQKERCSGGLPHLSRKLVTRSKLQTQIFLHTKR